jgi:hypothetical protein
VPLLHVKDRVYQPTIPQPFREPVLQGVANVDESQLWLTWEAFEYRVDVCSVTNAAYLKPLWINFVRFPAVLKLFRVCICNLLENVLIS